MTTIDEKQRPDGEDESEGVPPYAPRRRQREDREAKREAGPALVPGRLVKRYEQLPNRRAWVGAAIAASLVMSFMAGRVTAPSTPEVAADDEPEIAPVGGEGVGAWELTWSDEFDGDALDISHWTPEASNFGHGNAELQCHQPGNVSVADGMLTITAQRTPTECPNGSSHEFSSGMIRSRDHFSQAFGAFEIRAKAPAGQGLLSAFWMLSQDRPYGDSGRSGEIDVMEILGSEPGEVVTSVHWDYVGCQGAERWGCATYNRSSALQGPDASQDFHTYRVEWEDGKIRWLVDGQIIYTLGEGSGHRWGSAARNPAPGSPEFPAPFDESNDMYLLLSLAVGGSWAGAPDDATPFPAEFVVDYVRVYEQTD